MSDNPYLKALDSNPYLAELDSGSGSDWDELNSGKSAIEENTAIRKTRNEEYKKKPLLTRIYENAEAKYKQQQEEPILDRIKKTVGNLGLGPTAQVGESLNDLLSPILEETGVPDWMRVPSGNVAGLAKGYASVPAGISRRVWSTIAPGSKEEAYAGDMVRAIENESQNYNPSKTAEMGGQALFTAGLPGGPVLDKANTAGRVFTGAAKGAGYGLSDPGYDKTDKEYRDSFGSAATIGAVAGTAAEYAPEIISNVRKVAAGFENPATRLKELIASISGKPKNIIPEELAAEKIARINALDQEFKAAMEVGGKQKPNVKGIVAAIDDNLAVLNPQIEQDAQLIGRLESMKTRIQSGAPQVGGSRYDQLIASAKAGSADAPDLTIEGLSNWRRLVGQRQQAAFDTAGNAVQVTSSREHGNAIRSIKNAIDAAIEAESPETAMKLAQARGNWKEQMGPFIPDELGQDPVGRIIKTSTPDVEIRSLLQTKSEDLMNRVLNASTPRAKQAIQAEILDNAMKFHTKDGPIGLAKALTDEHGELIPAAYQAFKGADRDMLNGAVKLAVIADKLGKATNIAVGAGAATIGGSSIGAAFGNPQAGGGMGALAGGWAGRKWLPNWSAGGWERVIRSSRPMLVLLGKLPADSPEAQKIATSLLSNRAWDEEGDW